MTGTTARVLVLLPAYNEREALPGVLAELHETLPSVDVLVVDDGSRDDTAEVARRGGARVLRLPFNVGVGGALRAGLLLARREGYDVVVQCDSDGQHPPAEIPRLLAALAGNDLVIGARFAGEGDYRVRGLRALAMRFLATVMTRVHRTPLTDVTSGFRAFGPRAVAVLCAEMPREYLGDTVEALVVAKEHRLRVGQVAVTMRVRQGGVVSHRGLRSALYLGRVLVMLGLALMRLVRARRRSS
ncbi:glycosyltransferase family 2 protein [Nocardioides sp. SYSU D00038]|uniref:glycosyltransferase family 2 protein n=1 Tax=Nocardioides sp. SYSU D00038 TaxID=2812554 RepID=UPI00196857B0|nr:glycosyltransferase family 2 protein [Nocardioides sp. SYSU D00038]